MSSDEKTPETALEAALWSVREERNRGREEIDSLRTRVAELEAAIRRFAEQDATLTDAERAFFALHIERLKGWGRASPESRAELATVRGLLERLGVEVRHE